MMWVFGKCFSVQCPSDSDVDLPKAKIFRLDFAWAGGRFSIDRSDRVFFSCAAHWLQSNVVPLDAAN